MEEEELKSATASPQVEENQDDAAVAEAVPSAGLEAESEDKTIPKTSVAETATRPRRNAITSLPPEVEKLREEEDYANSALNPNADGFTNRSTGAKITRKAGAAVKGAAIGGLGTAMAADIGLIGISTAALAGDKNANNIFASGVDKIGNATKGWDSTNGGHDYDKAASNVGPLGFAGAGVSGALGAVSMLTGSLDIHSGRKRLDAASEKVVNPDGTTGVKDAAGVTLGKENIGAGSASVLSGAVKVTGAGLKIAAGAGAANAGALMQGASVLGAVGSGFAVAEGLFTGVRDAWNWFGGRSFSARTSEGKKWYEYAKSKKRWRMGLSALKVVGGALGIAAAAVGTVAGMGIPLLAAGAIIGGGMAAAKLYRKYNSMKKTSNAKKEMKDSNWYAKEGETTAGKEYNKKGTKAEKDQIQETKLAQKRKEKGGDAQSKYSVAKGIIGALKKAGGMLGITKSIEKVVSLVSKEKTAEKEKKQKEKDSKPGFWANLFGKKKDTSTTPDPKPLAESESSSPAAAAAAAAADTSPAAPSAEAAPPVPEAAQDKIENPTSQDEEVYDAAHISQKIGVTPEEAVSGSGEELIEKRLSVTNSL